MVKIYENIDLKPLNTFGIEAVAARLVEFSGTEDLREIFLSPGVADGRWNVLGGGSNILLSGDYHGTLLKASGTGIGIVSDDGTVVQVRAEAGVVWDDFVRWSVENGLWGAENLSHIPGTVGAAPVQNIGAYGCEAGDIISAVELYDVKSGTALTLAGGHCAFGYRDSVFKRELKGRVVITAVNFTLSRAPFPKLDYGDLREKAGANPTLAAIRDAVVGIRKSKLPEPEEMGNAGSFFRNPVVEAGLADELKRQYPDMPTYPAAEEGMVKLAAGWLIDRCGWKGRSQGRAGVHAKQALVLVNLGGATGAEVLALAEKICDDVRAKFGVDMEMEVNVW